MLTAVIVDDMPQAIENLKRDLSLYCPDVQVIGEAEGVVSGAKLLKQIKPDVLFLDIQLQDGSGFDLLEILPDIQFKLIFTTASDAFAIKAFRFAALDYLLKPIDPDQLMESVKKVKNQLEGEEQKIDVLLESVKSRNLPEKIALHTLEKVQIVGVSEIIRCESSGNYTLFYFGNNQKLLVTKTLKEFDKLLAGHQFLRVHQSHLINLRHLDAFVKTEGGYLLMKDGTHVPVSIRKRPMVLKTLEML